MATKQVKQLDRVIIRFAGDSGDGMQLTGDRFTQESAAFGNDLSTLPNFPAEIRAPQGTLPGVSSFQVHFADHDILTPGDAPDVLVAMNPAALRANLGDLPAGAAIIVDTHDFSARNLTKAGYEKSPLDDDSLASYAVHPLDLTGMTVEAVKEFGLSRKDAGRAKNMFALGLLSWMYGRPTETTIAFLEKRFAKVPDIRDANITAYRAGWNFGETTETFVVKYEIKPAPMKVGTYRNITGNLALSYGLVASGGALGAAPVPGVLPDHAGVRHPPRAEQAQVVRRHDLPGRGRDRRHRRRPRCGLRGRARGDHDLRPRPGAEVRDHRPRGDDRAPAAGDRRPARRPVDRAPDQDRAGRPAPGDVRPQRRVARADRRAAVARRLLRRRPRGRADRRHLPHAGDAAVRRHAGQRLRAVADPRARRAAHDRPRLRDRTATRARATRREFWPYLRDEETLARPWAIPGTAGLEHRIGGLEKADGNGNISYDPANHDFMVRTRQAKVDRIAESLPPLEVDDPSGEAKVLVLGWGSTYGPIGAGCRRVRHAGYHVAQVHLRHLNPLPRDLGEILKRYDRVLIPEMNLGQLSLLVRARYLVDAVGYHQVNGMPLKAAALAHAIADLVAEAEGIEAPLGVWGETVVKEHAK